MNNNHSTNTLPATEILLGRSAFFLFLRGLLLRACVCVCMLTYKINEYKFQDKKYKGWHKGVKLYPLFPSAPPYP